MGASPSPRRMAKRAELQCKRDSEALLGTWQHGHLAGETEATAAVVTAGG
jgi:hypothetical protein